MKEILRFMKFINFLRLLFFTTLFLGFQKAKAINLPDSLRQAPKTEITGNAQITNNGISPVPAFSLGKPAIMTLLNIAKGRFSFSPAFNYSIDGKPWSSNNWFRYKFPGQRLNFQIGVNWSLFFRKREIFEDGRSFEIQEANKYLENEVALSYKISEKSSLYFTWWHDQGIDIDAVRYGNFYSLAASLPQWPISKKLKLSLSPNFFYLENAIPFEGVFISAVAKVSREKWPVYLTLQGVQPLWVRPDANSSWNIGLNFGF